MADVSITADSEQEEYVLALPTSLDHESTEQVQEPVSNIALSSMEETRTVSTCTKLSHQKHSYLFEMLCKHATKWREIGLYLGVTSSELADIQARPLLMHDAPKSWLSAMLDEWLQSAPEDARGSTNHATLEILTDALNKTGLGETAESLAITMTSKCDNKHSD